MPTGRARVWQTPKRNEDIHALATISVPWTTDPTSPCFVNSQYKSSDIKRKFRNLAAELGYDIDEYTNKWVAAVTEYLGQPRLRILFFIHIIERPVLFDLSPPLL